MGKGMHFIVRMIHFCLLKYAPFVCALSFVDKCTDAAVLNEFLNKGMDIALLKPLFVDMGKLATVYVPINIDKAISPCACSFNSVFIHRGLNKI